MLTALAERLRDTIDAADCDIFTLRDDTLRCLVSADRDGLDTSVVGHVLDIDRFPATAMAVRTGEPMTIPGLDDPRLTDAERDDMAEYGYQSELCIPIVGGERVIGLIDVFDTRPRDYAEYLDFLRSVGQTAAGAIENALLLDKLGRRNAALAELVELGRTASNAGGLSELVRSVGPRVVELMEADGCQVFVLRNDTLFCVLTYDDGQFLDDYADRPLDLDLFPSTRVAIAERTALVIESPDDPRLSDYERRLYHESGTQSEICVPLVLEDRVVGLLDVYDHRRRDYAEHRDFLLRVGQMMAGAFENALLMERLEESNQTLALLVESGIEFGATLDRDDVLESVARRLCAATSAPNCDIFTLHGDVIRCVACIDHGTADADYVGTEYPVDQLGLARVALESRQPVYSENIADDERVSEFERREDLSWGHRAMLCLPLISRGEVIGVAGIYDDHARRFERTDFLHSLAQVAAGALANATLFEELDRSAERMALVGDVSFELSSSLELGEVLISTARRLCAISGAPMCDIYTLRDGAWLESVTSIDEGEVDAAWQGRRFPLDEWTAMRRAVETREPVVIESRNDPSLSPAEIALMEEFGESSALMVPLISRERVIGVLELTHREPQRTLLRRGDGDHRLDLPVRRARDRQRRALRGHQGDAPQQPEGPQLGAQRQGLLHARPRRPRGRVHGAARQRARLAGGPPARGRGGGLPPRHRQDRRAGQGAAQAERTQPRTSGSSCGSTPSSAPRSSGPLFDDALVDGVRHHHERWDGDGYPDGLAGEDIPAVARAMCVADSYDAMSFRRPYRQGLTDDECLEELERCSGVQFDPEMVAAFRRVLRRIAEGRRLAAGVAGRAAATLDPEECLALRELQDETQPEYASVTRSCARRAATASPARYLDRSSAGTAGGRSCSPTLRRAPARDAAPRRRGRQRRRARGGVRRARAPGERPVRRPVGRLDQRRGAGASTRTATSSPWSPPTSPPPRASRRSRACGATSRRRSPPCCTTPRCSRAAPSSRPSPTASRASTTTATSTSA